MTTVLTDVPTLPDGFAISGSYHVVVNAPGAAPAPAGQWLVRAFDVSAGGGELFSSRAHEDLEVAADHVFAAIRADIDARAATLSTGAAT